jgi:hypothetical protein
VEPFRRRHLVFTAYLPDDVRRTVADTEQDDRGQAPVVWLPVADATGLRLYPDVGAVLDQAVRPGTAAGGPLLLLAMTAESYVAPPPMVSAEAFAGADHPEAGPGVQGKAGGVLRDDPGLDGPDPGCVGGGQQREQQAQADALDPGAGVDGD